MAFPAGTCLQGSHPESQNSGSGRVEAGRSRADAHAALGYIHLIYDWDGPAAKTELERAIQLNPSLANARLNYAAYLTTQGRFRPGRRGSSTSGPARSVVAARLRGWRRAAAFRAPYRRSDCVGPKGLELERNFAFGLAFREWRTEQGRMPEAVGNCRKRRDSTGARQSSHWEPMCTRWRVRRTRPGKTDPRGGGRVQAPLFLPVRNRRCLREPWRSRYRLSVVPQRHRGSRRLHGVVGRRALDEPFRSDPRYAQLLREIGLSPPR